MNNQYDPPNPNDNDKLDTIAESLGAILWTIIVYGLFGLAALWRILFELQRG